jgi:bla regulator protein BlaR1
MNLVALANHLWQSTIFATIAWLLTQVLQENSARVRYSIWMLASLKFLLPLSLLITLGSHFSRPAKRYIAAPNVPVIEFIGLPFGERTLQLDRQLTSAARSAATRTPNQPAIEVLLAIWLVGFGAVGGSWLIRVRRVWEILSRARRLDDGREIESLERVRSLRGFARRIRCASTESVIEPGIHGILHPILVLPSKVAEQLESRQLDAIVDHELCHIRSYDNLLALIHMGVEAVFWFHPLVWWIGTRLVDERERACDEQVLENGGDPKVYASAILKVCEFYIASPLGCVAGVSGGNLKKRIEEIMNHRIVRKLSGGKKLLLVAAGVAALTVPIAFGVLNPPSIQAQSPGEPPRFDVASVKPNRSGGGSYVARTPGSLTATNSEFSSLLEMAYQTRLIDLSRVPAGLRSERFDIVAKASGKISGDQYWEMLQILLEDRFKVVYHRETKDAQVYALIVDQKALAKKGVDLGPKLSRSKDPDCPVNPDGANFCGVNPRPGMMIGQRVSMARISREMSAFAGRPVQDETGLTGSFDFQLTWTLGPMSKEDGDKFSAEAARLGAAGQPASDPSGSSFFSAVQEQLGLKLESKQGRIETIVIDHAEKPSEN